MRLTLRTTLTMLLVAGVPLAVAGWSSIQLSDEALRERARELHGSVADGLAEKIDDALQSRIRAVQQAAASVRFDTLRPKAVRGALRLIYRQVDGASAVALFDAGDDQVGVTEFLSAPQPGDALVADRPALNEADVGAFGNNLPLSAARQVGAATSLAYVSSAGEPRLAIGVTGYADYVLAVEISLSDLQSVVEARRIGSRGRGFVVDGDGRVVLAAQPEAVAAREERKSWEAVAAVLARQPVPTRFVDPRLGDALGAAAPIESFGWWVVVAEPSEDALAAARALTQRTLLWLLVAVLAAGLLGVLSARAVVKPIRLLRHGALSLEKGDFSHRISGEDRGDELGDLAKSFNTMAEEIQRWNQELEDRVATKTQELREAQELLLRSQKMAAVGELGAGVAHEINNPLTGLLGITQLALRKEPEGTKLRQRLEIIQKEALRIRDIVGELEQITGSRGDGNARPVDLTSVLDGTLNLVQARFDETGISVVRDYQTQLPRVTGNEEQLGKAFLHLVDNAWAAMPEGGTLTVALQSDDGQLVSARLTDTGEGIPADIQSRIFEPFFSTRRSEERKGLGLSLVSKIVDSHHGRVKVDSAAGEGASFTVIFPAAQARSLV